MLALLIIGGVLGFETYLYYEKSKELNVDLIKWVFIGIVSFLFLIFPICILIFSVFNYININFIIELIIRIILYEIISNFIKYFIFKRMEREAKLEKNDETLLDDMNFN